MSSTNDSIESTVYRPRGERPYLLPFNRRLRHLHGIFLRNLTLTATPTRPRTRTYDDNALSYSLSSPTKLLALTEHHKLVHSRSASNLKTQQDASSVDDANPGSGVHNGHPVTPDAKSRQQLLRRQSTADWANSSPKLRKRRVVDAIARHTADVFFSLHAEDRDAKLLNRPWYQDTPSYDVKEFEADDPKNPDFRFFDLNVFSSFIARRTNFTIKFWAKHQDDHQWAFLLDMPLDLRDLQYVGRSLENHSQLLPENCVLFVLSDGIYASAPDMRVEPQPTDLKLLAPPPFALPSSIESTSSYEALMKLSTLDACIQDALATQHKLASEIQDLVAERRDCLQEPVELAVARDANAHAHRAVNHAKNQLSRLAAHASTLHKGLSSRRAAMRAGRAAHAHYNGMLGDNATQLASSRALHAKMQDDLAGQRRRIVSDLASIYPIEPAPARARTPASRSQSPHPHPLSFTIRRLPIPTGSFAAPRVAAATAAAALGHTAHALALLAAYTAVPLPYPLGARGSTSSVADPISQLATPAAQRAFPLSLPARYDTTAAAAGTAAFDRFEYAVFLLNKDIETLAGRAAGLRVLDLGHTLPNLKYLMLVATAGRGELPGRKIGGVRGLLRHGGGGGAEAAGSAGSSRRGSDESGAGEGGRAAEAVRRRLRAVAA